MKTLAFFFTILSLHLYSNPISIAQIDEGYQFTKFYKILFSRILKSPYEIWPNLSLCPIKDTPDILFYYLCRKPFNFNKVHACHSDTCLHDTLKILISSEPWNFQCCYADIFLSTERESCNYPANCIPIYLPWYSISFSFRQYQPKDLIKNLSKNDLDHILASKTEFCAFLYQTNTKPRVTFFNKLAELYKSPTALGSLLGDPNGVYDRWEQAREEDKGRSFFDPLHYPNIPFVHDSATQKYIPFKFALAIENHPNSLGYITEKMVNIMLANTIPIYYGPIDIADHFNPKSFINLRDFNSIEECIEYIKKVDQDDELYKQILAEPFLPNNELTRYFSWHPDCKSHELLDEIKQAIRIKCPSLSCYLKHE